MNILKKMVNLKQEKIGRYLETHLRQNHIVMIYYDFGHPGQFRVPFWHEKFPYLINTSPKTQEMPDGSTILKYIGSAKTANGHAIPISIKVKANEEGKILQISSSR